VRYDAARSALGFVPLAAVRSFSRGWFVQSRLGSQEPIELRAFHYEERINTSPDADLCAFEGGVGIIAGLLKRHDEFLKFRQGAGSARNARHSSAGWMFASGPLSGCSG
jgi:hypothetical protein